MKERSTLLIQCKDDRGLLAAICEFLAKNNANILGLQEFADERTNQFYARVEWDNEGFQYQNKEAFSAAFHDQVGSRFGMNIQHFHCNEKTRVCLFVSKYSHCLEDLLYRCSSNELAIEIPLIVSNHDSLKAIADARNIPFYHLPITKENKAEQEQKQKNLIAQYNCELVVLARYMQILSSDFVHAYQSKIINIHHSFLPAFTGAKHYHAAYDRGVKIIGATAHFVTEDLDEGPIICQDVTKITHKDSIQDMIIKGRDSEKSMLSKAVKLFSEHKILTGIDQRTIVFE